MQQRRILGTFLTFNSHQHKSDISFKCINFLHFHYSVAILLFVKIDSCRKIKRKLQGSSVLQVRLKSLSSMDTAVLDEKEVICWQSDNSVRYVEVDRVTTVWPDFRRQQRTPSNQCKLFYKTHKFIFAKCTYYYY